jgi:hypothetical protein
MKISAGISFALGAVFALTIAGGSAYAATGGTFLLGRANSASTTTSLSNSAGTPLSLSARSGYAPLKVNSGTKVGNLNSDKLDGLDSTQLQRTVQSCPAGTAIQAVASSGAVTCKGASGAYVFASLPNGYAWVIAWCPSGYVATGGGYFLDGLGMPRTLQIVHADYGQLDPVSGDPKPREGYYGQFVTPSGDIYAGSGSVQVACMRGTTADLSPASP